MLESINVFGEDIGVSGSVLQDMFDMVHPIGKIYVQYPNQKTPMEVYNNDKIQSVWEEQLQYNSAFFRSENAPSKVYKADDESQYYFYNGTSLIPANIEGLSAPTKNTSDVIIIDNKTYYAYNAGNGWKTNTSNVFNGDLQTNQNKTHKHNNTVSVSQQPNFTTTDEVGACFEFDAIDGHGWSGWPCAKIEPYLGEVHEDKWSKSGDDRNHDISANITDYNTVRYNYYAYHSHPMPITTNAAVGITNNDAGGDESRPDNYTYRIWKRIG